MLLLLPFDRRVDWKRPPLITLGLILINCFVYFVLQAPDSAKLATAYHYYHDSDLPTIEFPLYRDFLRRHGRMDELRQFQSEYQVEQGAIRYRIPWLPQRLDTDYDFITALRAGKLLSAKDPRYPEWQQQRERYDGLLNATVIQRYSLRPALKSLGTMISSMFLHASVMHLVGNMVFLFIVGFVVETILGRRWYLAVYLLAGLASAGLDVAMRPHDLNYHLGASGAISGIMGAYAVLFGLRKIAFFYNILFWFDRITAPAIIMLPLWLADEALQLLLDTASHVNYLAHIGGMVGGSILTWGARHYDKQLDVAYIEEPQRDRHRREQLDRALQLLAQLKPEQAKPVLTKLLLDAPGDTELLTHLYHASRFDPAAEDYHRYARQLLLSQQLSLNERLRLLEEYSRLAKPGPRLASEDALKLAQLFLAGGKIETAERLTVALLRRDQHHPALPALLLRVAKVTEKNRAATYLKFIINHFPASAEARTARALLQLD